MKQLVCRILIHAPSVRFGDNYQYGVFDGENLVATGVSSSLDWVRHDAGGYHTSEFDKLYPEGWNVTFELTHPHNVASICDGGTGYHTPIMEIPLEQRRIGQFCDWFDTKPSEARKWWAYIESRPHNPPEVSLSVEKGK